MNWAPRFTCQPELPILNPDCLGGKGFLLDMLEMLKADINITVPLDKSIDGKFGGKTKNGSFNGAVGMLTRDQIQSLKTELEFWLLNDLNFGLIFPTLQKDPRKNGLRCSKLNCLSSKMWC